VKKGITKSLLAGLLCLVQFGLFAQVNITFSAPKDSFEIGEDISLELTIRFDNENVVPGYIRISVLDSMSIMKYLFPDDSLFREARETDFEIPDYGFWANNQKKDFTEEELAWDEASNKGVFTNKLVIKIWDPGMFRVMITDLQYRSNDGKIWQYFPKTNEAKIIVIKQPNTKELTDLAPIDPIIRRYFPGFYFRYILLIFSLAVLIYTLTGLIKNRPEKTINWQFSEKPALPAHEIALKKLQLLASSGYCEQGEIKLFYSELSFITREYIENRFRVAALESTTDELMRAIQPYLKAESQHKSLNEILSLADLVKFAKAEPPADIHVVMLQKAMELVDQTTLVTPQKTSGK